MIMNYDGTPQSYQKCKIAYFIHNRFNLYGPVIMSFAFVIPLKLAAASANATVALWLNLYISVNAGCLIPTFFYSMWQNAYDKWLCFFPINESKPPIKITTRIMITTFFTVWGVFSGVMAALCMTLDKIGMDTSMRFTITFVVTWIPFMLECLFFSIANMGLVLHSLTNKVEDVNKFTYKISKGNYAIDPLVLLSRDEFGILFTNMNNFFDSTRNLLKGVHANVDSTLVSSAELTENMKASDSNIKEIVSSVDSVKSEMNNQSNVVENTIKASSQILNNIDVLNNNVDNQSSAVNQSSTAVKEMISNINTVTSILEKNQIQAKQLDNASNNGLQKVNNASKLSEKILEESKGLLDA